MFCNLPSIIREIEWRAPHKATQCTGLCFGVSWLGDNGSNHWPVKLWKDKTGSLVGRWMQQQFRSLNAEVHKAHCGGHRRGTSAQGVSTSRKSWCSGAACLGDNASLMDMCYLDSPWYYNFPNRFHTRTTAATRRSIPRHAQAHESCHGPGPAELFLKCDLLLASTFIIYGVEN